MDISASISSFLEYLDQRSIVISSIVTLGAIYYWYDKYYYSYWKRKGIPSPPTKLFFGNILDFPVGHLSLYYTKLYEKYGPIYGIYIFKERVLVVHDVNLVKKILVADHSIFTDRTNVGGDPLEARTILYKNGESWKHDRAILNKSFKPSKMQAMFPLMKSVYVHLEKELERISEKNIQVDTKDLFSKLTSMIIARCAFAAHVDAYTDSENILLINLRKFVEMSFIKGLAVNMLPKFILKKFKIGIFDSSATTYLANICREIMRQRKQAAGNGKVQDYDDLLQVMTDSRGANNESINDEDIIANAVFFFTAGHGTTTALLTWISYLLAKNPEVQEKLHEEVKHAIANTGSLDYETLFGIKYLDAVVNETLRLYTPVTMQLRVNIEDYELPNGIVLDKGTSVHIPSYSIHHNPKYFHDPETFNPERFMSSGVDFVDSGAFLPFSLGPRNCIGQRLSLIETKMAIAEICNKFKFVLSENTKADLANHPIIVEPKNMFLRVQRR